MEDIITCHTEETDKIVEDIKRSDELRMREEADLQDLFQQVSKLKSETVNYL